MLESKTKTITRWGLTIKDCDVFFPTKETAIKIGKMALKTNPDVVFFEEYRLFDLPPGKPQILIDKQRFDRTILIKD